MRVLVLSDTHRKAGDDRPLPQPVLDALAETDAVLHAGDVTSRQLLDELGTAAPVHAVLGNNDDATLADLPERLELDLGGVRVAMVHDSGARKGRENRMRRWFPDADVVVFGHSHDPVDDEGADGQRLFNPGSPTQRRRQPQASFGVLELAAGRVVDHRIVRF
ncbi:MAG TPA: metallophosphoesterase family protein [Acidimicrobiales bacterium]|nr:metallophosphoesterase family protein [Acidimicrobiales bacterium]